LFNELKLFDYVTNEYLHKQAYTLLHAVYLLYAVYLLLFAKMQQLKIIYSEISKCQQNDYAQFVVKTLLLWLLFN